MEMVGWSTSVRLHIYILKRNYTVKKNLPYIFDTYIFGTDYAILCSVNPLSFSSVILLLPLFAILSLNDSKLKQLPIYNAYNLWEEKSSNRYN
jgi:hypothetical protein